MNPGAIRPLAGRVALVTGGSNGIGAASVRALAEAGATVCVGFNSGQDRAEALIATLPPGSHGATRISLEDS
jgi:3-oxoacyl-[acyl-carrier protein] reductase